ncbi:MAG: hypothetical protein KDA28_10605 [Phycisphaerales bacterium]|nr:hypothetical protein [Phycisphaerales bacterium]
MGARARRERRRNSTGGSLLQWILLDVAIFALGPLIFGGVLGGTGFFTLGTVGLIGGGIVGVLIGLVVSWSQVFGLPDLFDLF